MTKHPKMTVPVLVMRFSHDELLDVLFSPRIVFGERKLFPYVKNGKWIHRGSKWAELPDMDTWDKFLSTCSNVEYRMLKLNHDNTMVVPDGERLVSLKIAINEHYPVLIQEHGFIEH